MSTDINLDMNTEALPPAPAPAEEALPQVQPELNSNTSNGQQSQDHFQQQLQQAQQALQAQQQLQAAQQQLQLQQQALQLQQQQSLLQNQTGSKNPFFKKLNWVNAAPQHFSPDDASIIGKKRRRRTTQEELDVLEAHFKENPLPNSQQREKLAKDTGMTPRAVQVWFQNRRQSLKKKAAVQDEIKQALKRPKNQHANEGGSSGGGDAGAMPLPARRGDEGLDSAAIALLDLSQSFKAANAAVAAAAAAALAAASLPPHPSNTGALVGAGVQNMGEVGGGSTVVVPPLPATTDAAANVAIAAAASLAPSTDAAAVTATVAPPDPPPVAADVALDPPAAVGASDGKEGPTGTVGTQAAATPSDDPAEKVEPKTSTSSGGS
ncbi:hypothetical protein HK104_004652 [Borealophlyctis nickersoniae]|nr:hypothetical protein HK104_004652 [Borealophlyctis nickersoniae]